MDWKIDSSRPVYQQIMAHIRQAVLSKEYPPGSRIPSVRDLAAKLKVNPNTIQRAMTELELEGLLVTQGTLGKFVTDDPQTIRAIREEAVREAVTESAAMFLALGLSMEEAAKLLLDKEV